MGRPLTVGLRIGPLGVSIAAPNAVQRGDLASFYDGFLADARPSFWNIRLQPFRKTLPLKTPRVIERDGAFTVDWSRFQGRLDWRSKTGALAAQSPAVVGTFLRAFASHVLPKSSGFLLHSAGHIAAGRAYVFAGASGAGKSTLSKLAAPGARLSDEIVLLVKNRRGWRAHGTPFAGELPGGRRASAPLGALYFLEKATAWSRRPIPRGEAARRLLRCVLSFGADQRQSLRLLDAAENLVQSVPCFALRFAKTLPKGKTLEGLTAV